MGGTRCYMTRADGPLDEGPGDPAVAVPHVGEGVLVLDRGHVEGEGHLAGPILLLPGVGRPTLATLKPLAHTGYAAKSAMKSITADGAASTTIDEGDLTPGRTD